EAPFVKKYWLPKTYAGAVTRDQALELSSAVFDSRMKPAALVFQERTARSPERARLNEGTTAVPAGGVTLAQEVPIRSSSAMVVAGCNAAFAVPRSKKTKLAT